MKPFDVSTCPLAGVNLIEASAGTGKTYALAGLYLRFLVEQNLPARQLLVITYTKAATAELKRRIRQMIADAQNAFLQGVPTSRLLGDLLEKYSGAIERKRIIRNLSLALANYDETAIYTIHGFCRRILTDHAFASGTLFETEMIENQQALEREFVADFWRRHFYEQDPVMVQYALSKKMNQDWFVSVMHLALSKPGITIIPEFKPFSMDQFQKEVKSLRENYRRFKKLWCEEKETIVKALRDQGLSGAVYGRKVDALVIQVEETIGADDVCLPMADCMEKLSSEYLRRKTKKEQKTPEHSLFDLGNIICRQSKALADLLDQYLSGLKKEFLDAVAGEFPRLKEKRNVLYFDDLLVRAHEALRESGSDRLAAILRRQYHAVLVDEFQDTDPLQFAILQSVFAENEKKTKRSLFYIGDPKQAIYSFRGADIYAYLRAAQTVDEQYTMMHNWRSEAALIRAVNVLFEKSEQPFVYKEISYSRIEPAPDLQIAPLKIAGEEAAGIEWWFVPGADDEKPLGIGEARKLINRRVVAEISRLIKLGREKKAWIGTQELRESDLAVLVRTNAEAIAMNKLLSEAGIPSLIYSAESVFSSYEVEQLRLLMLGIIHCEEEGRLLTALSTDFFGLRADDIAACLEQDDRLEDFRIQFKVYNDLWQAKGFLALFTMLLEREGVRRRIASHPDGERRLTNYFHLAVQLSQAQMSGNLSPSTLLRWFDDMSLDREPSGEDQQLRLETDRDCIRIITIHKSKGLEYPICFCPFVWETGANRKDILPLCFHDEENNWQNTLDLGSDRLPEHLALNEREALAEDCRLLYVALTRAKSRCYFVWGNIRDTQANAATYLFNRTARAEGEALSENEKMMNQMWSFANLAPGDIRITSIDNIPVVQKWCPGKEKQEITYRPFKGKIDHQWGIASYTYLTRASQEETEWDEETHEIPSVEAVQALKASDNILLFPPGATSGILLHEILEKIDYARVGEDHTKIIVRNTLEKFGYSPLWETGILNMLDTLMRTRLDDAATGGFSLSQIDPLHCQKEMEFYFPLQNISPEKLLSVLECQEKRLPPTDHRKLFFPPTHGFLKGFIDLVFEHTGRYYLADWKSNVLGNQYEHYAPDLLKKEMRKSYYDVQYLIYTLALDIYLKKRRPEYDYDRDFGGVFYFFLRGLNTKTSTKDGIFFDRPDRSFILELEKVLRVP